MKVTEHHSSKRYSLLSAARLLGTGRTTLCRQLREIGMLDGNNLATRAHTAAGRLVVELHGYTNPGLGLNRTYGKTLVTDKGLRYIANRLGLQVHDQTEARDGN